MNGDTNWLLQTVGCVGEVLNRGPSSASGVRSRLVRNDALRLFTSSRRIPAMDDLSLPRMSRFDDFLLDRHTRSVTRIDGVGIETPVPMGSRAFDLLCMLMEQSGVLLVQNGHHAGRVGKRPGRGREPDHANLRASAYPWMPNGRTEVASRRYRAAATASCRGSYRRRYPYCPTPPVVLVPKPACVWTNRPHPTGRNEPAAAR